MFVLDTKALQEAAVSFALSFFYSKMYADHFQPILARLVFTSAGTGRTQGVFLFTDDAQCLNNAQTRLLVSLG